MPYLDYMAQYPDDKFDYMSLYKDLGFVSAQSRIDPSIYIMRPDYKEFIADIVECWV